MKFRARLTVFGRICRRVAIACLGVLIAVCSAGIPDPRVPAPPQKEDDGSYPIYADLTNADIKSGQELNSDQRSKMPDLSGESSKSSHQPCKKLHIVSTIPATKAQARVLKLCGNILGDGAIDTSSTPWQTEKSEKRSSAVSARRRSAR